MPVFEMPLEKLREYGGRNPRPADFDAYWERALAEMRATDPAVELVPHALEAPFAECFHLYFTGVGKARIHAKYLRPAGARVISPSSIQNFHSTDGTLISARGKAGFPSAVTSPFTWSPWQCEITTISIASRLMPAVPRLPGRLPRSPLLSLNAASPLPVSNSTRLPPVVMTIG